MDDIFVGMALDIAMLKARHGNSIKVGPVEQLDPQKGYRIRLGGTDAEPYLSPWIPHPESGKSSVPLKKGQIVGLLSPVGDMRKAILVRGGYSDEHASPNEDMAANVFRDAGVTVTIASGKLIVEGDIEFKGNSVKHNGKEIGDTHKHTGVVPGGGLTGVPE